MEITRFSSGLRAGAAFLVYALGIGYCAPCAWGEAASPYVGFLAYPDYTMARFQSDMQTLRLHMPQRAPTDLLIEKKVLEFFSAELKERIGSYYKGNETVDLAISVLSQYANQGGEYYANADTKALIDPLAEVMWNKIKKEAIEHVLGSTLASTFNVAEIAEVPIALLESAWIVHISSLRNADVQQALQWYVRKRYEYDYARHRDLMLRGENFRAIQWSPRFPWDFDPSCTANPAPYPFGLYGFEPYYIRVEAETGAAWLFGNWNIFLGGAAYDAGDEVQPFYNLWANILYAERNIAGTDLDRELQALGKNAGQAYVRGIVKRHADAMLRDFMEEFERFYYDLYTSRYLHEIRRTVAMEAALVSILQWRDRELLASKAATEAEYQQMLAAYNQMIANEGNYSTNAGNAQATAGGYLEQRNGTTNPTERCAFEASYVEAMVGAMTNAAGAARECESGRVNYSAYLEFVAEYGPSSPNYTTLECQDNRIAYMAVYDPLQQNLREGWQSNVTEFAALRQQIVDMGRRVSAADNDPLQQFTPVFEYARKIGSVPMDPMQGLSEDCQSLFAQLWSTNADAALDTGSVAYIQQLPASSLEALGSDVDTVESRLYAHKAKLDAIMQNFPSRDEIRQVHEVALRAEKLYNDLVKGHPSLPRPRGGWSSCHRSFTWWSECDSSVVPFFRYPVEWVLNASLVFDPTGTDLTSFSLGDYGDYATHFLAITGIDPMRDREENITNSLSFVPAHRFRDIVEKAYAEIRTGLDCVQKARDLLAVEEARRNDTPDLYWTRLHEQPNGGLLPYSASLAVPEVDGWGGCYSMVITPDDIGVIGFHIPGIRTVDLSDPSDPQLLDHVDTEAIVAGLDVAGDWACLSGGWWDLALVNISDPQNLPSPAVERTTWPDDGGVSEDVALDGSYAFVADGPAGLKVYDLNTVTNSPTGTADAVLPLTGAVAVAISSPYAYVACGSNGLAVVDISFPTNPVVAAQCNTAPAAVWQVEVVDDRAILAMGSNGVAFVDCSQPSGPVVLSVDMSPGFFVRHAVMTGDTVLAVGTTDDWGGFGRLRVYTLNDDYFLVPGQSYNLPDSARHVALHQGYAWISCTSSSHLYGVEMAQIAPAKGLQRASASFAFSPRVELQVHGRGGGEIVLTPGSLATRDRVVTHLATGTVVTVTAYPDSGVQFGGWEGCMSGMSTAVTFTVASNTYLAARFDPPGHVITSSASDGGDIDPSGTITVLQHNAQAFTISNDAGHVVSNIFVDGVAKGSLREYQFRDVTNSHSIHAAFVAVDSNSCGVAAGAGPGGSVFPFGWNAFPQGATVTHTITADPQYRVVNVRVDATNYAALDAFVFTNISGVHHLYAEFAREARVVTARSGRGGTVEPKTPWVLEPGGTGIVVLASADPWYYISEVRSNGMPIGSWSEATTSAVFSFVWPAEDVNLDIRFEARRTSATQTPLWWLAQHGITDDFENAVLLDHDADGIPAWQEFVADTDPQAFTSVLQIGYARVTNLTEETAGWIVSFHASADRLYEIEGAWHMDATSLWNRLATSVVGSNQTVTLQLTNATQFLRLRATLP